MDDADSSQGWGWWVRVGGWHLQPSLRLQLHQLLTPPRRYHPLPLDKKLRVWICTDLVLSLLFSCVTLEKGNGSFSLKSLICPMGLIVSIGTHPHKICGTASGTMKMLLAHSGHSLFFDPLIPFLQEFCSDEPHSV